MEIFTKISNWFVIKTPVDLKMKNLQLKTDLYQKTFPQRQDGNLVNEFPTLVFLQAR